MKIKQILGLSILTIAISSNLAGAAQVCGEGGKSYNTIIDKYGYAYTCNPTWYPSGGAGQYCLEYDSSNNYTLFNCREVKSNHTCALDYKWTQYGCEACPEGFQTTSYGIDDHMETECPFCKIGYYNAKGPYSKSCTACPDGGTSKNINGNGMTREISDCFLAMGTTNTDSTGSFSITSDCYYIK